MNQPVYIYERIYMYLNGKNYLLLCAALSKLLNLQVKVWFQNRRMKHKRQTLGKQGEDGDDKDSVTSDGGKSGKVSSDKFLDDEMSKKSCQGCEMPPAGICTSHDEIPDIGATRGNNNNTPSATNNNTSFNNNSNGASSVGSTGSFDKMIAEDDSRSNEDSGVHSSPRIGKKGPTTPTTVSIKTESRRNSPNACDRKIGLSKVSPNIAQKDVGTLHASTDTVSIKMTPKTLPPSLHSSPLGINTGTNMMYSHLQRSSPATATAIASATVTIQNVPNTIPPFVSRGSAGSHFQNQYQMGSQGEYKESRPKTQPQYSINQSMYNPSEIYNPEHPSLNDTHGFPRGQGNANALPHGSRSEMSSRMAGRSRQVYHSNYQNQQHYYYGKNQGASGEPYGHNINNQHYNSQGYHSEHSYNHYNYPANMYPNDGTETMGAHVPNPVHLGHDASSYYSNDTNMHPMHKVQNQAEYPNKVGYYENSNYNNANHMAPNTESSNYIHSDVYSASNNATAMATAAVMTPPASVQTDSSDNYNSYHQFYAGENTQTQVPPAGENSNSSSDFNFLSNLANDYTPEYYQI